ncbi:MAG: alpha-glucan family phosphorylase [Deltaproteobacteria bacterium]|nr:alpha-glucan family phosphorylase [Deltaproteobacteria bacterium]MBN2674424.1 alpha-glucan family phosphorylase [Deltaproteobacteria bacterium]
MKYLFEVSWEVCNLVGGIHTVIRSKASQAVNDFGDNYFLLGPLLDNNIDFEESDDATYQKIRPALEEKGLQCKLGRWKADGNPRVILVNFKDKYDSGKLLYQYWQRFGVNSMGSNWDYIEPVIFSTACGEVIETIHDTLVDDADTSVAHFHEWMSGGGLLHLKKTTPEIGTVFTTHATILGRSMCGAGVDIYSEQVSVDPVTDATKYGVPSKASLESVCAREADIFTTVSNVTADEAAKMLGKRPHYAVFNGINTDELGSMKEIREKAKSTREKVISLASAFLGHSLPDNTQLWATAGRYEYRNKGYDVFLESLAKLNTELKENTNAPTIVAWFLIATGNEGVKQSFKDRIDGKADGTVVEPGVLTHSLHNEQYDAIVQACQRLGLNNNPANKVKVIFSPAYINDSDGVFNTNYYRLLSSFDLGVFPSNYEPWGYTPMESIAVGVPTITSDLAGFGRWARELNTNTGKSVQVINRANQSYETICDNLYRSLLDFAFIGKTELNHARSQARKIADMASWSAFYKNYQKSYSAATIIAEKRLNSLDTSAFSDELFISFKGAEGPGPHYRLLTVAPQLPKQLKKLGQLANNLWWAWHPEACELFEELDPYLWVELESNPVLMLEKIHPSVLEEKVNDRLYIKKYNRIIEQFENYMNAPGRKYDSGGALDAQHPVAYFSMEFCIHECLPIYSGGLGVLSGDHMKSASDLNLPLVGIGFFYKQGYFQQQIDISGNQIEHYPMMDPSTLPIEALRDENSQEIRISVSLPGREVVAKIWQVRVGRIKLYLLDTDVDENHPDDRRISSKLYGGGKQMRIEQELILGIGGVKLLEDRLHLKPQVYHLNEGHCGFLLFERIERFMNEGLSFQEAREMVKASSVFTTHTPVPAGNETFHVDLMKKYFSDLPPRLSITFDQLIEMGFSKIDEENQEFSMTVLALKLSSRANGVSKLHGKVCRDMWQDVWKELDRDEVPITSITNGIHITSWIGEDIKRLLDQYLDINWDENQDDPLVWMRVDQVPNEIMWYEHRAQKKRLIEQIKEKLYTDYSRRGESPTFIKESIEALNPDALTIGFARRFATYKRATLLFRHRDALANLLNDPEKPVQLLFAGKAHPADTQGKELIKRIIEESRSVEFKGKIFYLENYNMKLGRLLTQGVDIWLNTPVRPHEASGTSGMKVVPNGGINCSILDGWWDEGYDEEVGYAIQSMATPINRNHQDEMDNNALFNILLNEITTTYYDRDKQNIPVAWVARMKAAFKKLAPVFSTMRMVNEYHERLYIPTAKRAMQLRADNYQEIGSLTAWKRSIKARFSTVQIDHIKIKGLEGDMLPAQTPLEIEMIVIPGKMKEDELRAELIIGQDAGDRFADEPRKVELMPVESPDPTVFKYTLSHQLDFSGTFRYALRVVPTHPLLTCTQETGLVQWA